MNLTACKVLIDQVVYALDITTRALNIKNAKKEFQKNGIGDTKTGFYHDMKKIIATCKRKLSKEE